MATRELRRVAVTGLGAICGLGNDVPTIWANAVAGKCGISKIESFDASELPIQIAGEVKNFSMPEEIMNPKEAGRVDRFIQFAIYAAHEALKDADLLPGQTHYAPERMGSILGVGMGGFPMIEATHKQYLERGPRRVSPFFIPGIIPNMAPGMISLHYGLKGVNFSTASACASSGHAIGAAVQEIMLGNQDVVVTGGSESVIAGLTISGFANMKAMTKTHNDSPETSSCPWDMARDGFVIGEGSGILVLEDFEKAQARGAKIYAEVVGYGSSADAHHITAPHPEGEGAIRCIKQSLEVAGLTGNEIDYINAHGTSTPLGDIAETEAIKTAFGDHAKELVVSSTKSMTGHLLGAAGGIETIMCVMAVHTDTIPPTINLNNQDPKCDLFYAPNKAVKRTVNYALNNSFGFGGTNATTILKKV